MSKRSFHAPRTDGLPALLMVTRCFRPSRYSRRRSDFGRVSSIKMASQDRRPRISLRCWGRMRDRLAANRNLARSYILERFSPRGLSIGLVELRCGVSASHGTQNYRCRNFFNWSFAREADRPVTTPDVSGVHSQQSKQEPLGPPNLSNWISVMLPVQPLPQKHSASPFPQITSISPAIPPR